MLIIQDFLCLVPGHLNMCLWPLTQWCCGPSILLTNTQWKSCSFPLSVLCTNSRLCTVNNTTTAFIHALLGLNYLSSANISHGFPQSFMCCPMSAGLVICSARSTRMHQIHAAPPAWSQSRLQSSSRISHPKKARGSYYDIHDLL